MEENYCTRKIAADYIKKRILERMKIALEINFTFLT